MVSTCLNGFNMSPWHRRKVYGIVACQVSVTALAAALACGPLQHPMVAMAVCLGLSLSFSEDLTGYFFGGLAFIIRYDQVIDS